MTLSGSDISILFMGTPEFAVPALRRLAADGFRIAGVVTQPDRPQGRHMELVPPPVKRAAETLGVTEILQPERMSEPWFADRVRELSPDLIVTAAYGKILPAAILGIPRCCINIHASLLPRYRGAAPIPWCIIRGDTVTGVTIMLMDEGMDTGDILRSRETPIPPDMDAAGLTEILSAMGAEMVTDTILSYLNGEIRPVHQDPALATTVRPIVKEDGRIDWTAPAESVHNRVRGCRPWPGAFTMLGTRRMKIFRTAVCKELPVISQDRHNISAPGTIIRSDDKSRLFAVCGEGSVEILGLQLEGCRMMAASECAHNIAPGSRFC